MSLCVSLCLLRGQIIDGLFAEIDLDGSGLIDKVEFRMLLKTLDLSYRWPVMEFSE